MSVLQTIRGTWTPADQLFEAASGDGLEPTTYTRTVPADDVGRHRLLLTTLALAALAVGPLAGTAGTTWAPPIILAPIVLVSGLLLRLPGVVVVVAASTLSAAVTLTITPEPVQLAIVALITALALRLSYLRDSVGLRGLHGDRALVGFKGQIKMASHLPSLPRGWGRKAVVQPAPGALFGGDFFVAHRDGDNVQVALVDVSGKGDDAAAHALTLVGAFGGLLGSVPANEFLAACNAYLMRGQQERLVTAVHLDLDLATGRYTATSAGHPPAAHYAAGSGTWQLSPSHGVALGVTVDTTWMPASGVLHRGEALMLLTNGVWGPRTDPETGIDRVLGEADTLIQRGGFADLAPLLVKSAGNREDDASMVLIWRT